MNLEQNKMIRDSNRGYIYTALANWVHNNFPDNAKKQLADAIKQKFIADDTSYGLASEKDFGEYAIIFSNLFAHNNKQYYIYKAISDSNKVGYLSRRQYYKLCLKEKIWNKIYGSGSRDANVTEFLAKNGTMASPYKLLKRAFKENPRAKFLAYFFPLLEDKKTTQNEGVLIALCDLLMRNKTNITIEPASVDECYKVKLTDDYGGSGERFATSSCMYNYPVGRFYEAFGAEGRIVYERGKPIGRFILWTFPDGKQYVDRLYVQGHGHEDALAEIDKQYPNAYKYPELRDNSRIKYLVPLKDESAFRVAKDKPQVPYVDTFSNLIRFDGKYYLCNCDEPPVGKWVSSLYDVRGTRNFSACPHCGQLYWSGDTEMDAANKNHLLLCTAYKPRQKKLQEMIQIYRNFMNNGGAYDATTKTALFEI